MATPIEKRTETGTPEMERIKKSLTTETLWPWILALLSRKPRHAYVLRNEIKKEFGFLPGTVTCYKVLYILKSRKYVAVKRDGRRKVYYPTEKGKQELLKAKMLLNQLSRELHG